MLRLGSDVPPGLTDSNDSWASAPSADVGSPANKLPSLTTLVHTSNVALINACLQCQNSEEGYQQNCGSGLQELIVQALEMYQIPYKIALYPQVLLPKIAELWDALHVPLLYRSRFFLAFRGRETFYFEAEHRRLTWLRSETGSLDDGSPEAARAAQRRLGRAHRMLDVRFWIYRPLKTEFNLSYKKGLKINTKTRFFPILLLAYTFGPKMLYITGA